MKEGVVPSPPLDSVFGALADPTRRAIVERLMRRGELAAGDIAANFAISFPAISRHLRVLEEAGLIQRRAEKQKRLIRARPETLALAQSWIEQQRAHWTAALDRLEAVLAAETPQGRKT
jgi:DNA-binding transcriptional ArsR family regulator